VSRYHVQVHVFIQLMFQVKLHYSQVYTTCYIYMCLQSNLQSVECLFGDYQNKVLVDIRQTE